MERYGMENYLRDSNARKVNKGELGTLYHITYPDRTMATVVQVTNSTPEKDGTFKKYVLQVPRQMTTADDAVAWTFGFNSAERYKNFLQQET